MFQQDINFIEKSIWLGGIPFLLGQNLNSVSEKSNKSFEFDFFSQFEKIAINVSASYHLINLEHVE